MFLIDNKYYYFYFQILKYIKKISKLPITIKILQKTSVGHLVNSFRANEGAIGKLCTCLVLRWKFIVIEEETRKYYKND